MGEDITLEDVKRLRLQPGDVLVVRCREQVSQSVASAILRRVAEVFPENRVLVMDAPVEGIEVWGPEAVPPYEYTEQTPRS